MGCFASKKPDPAKNDQEERLPEDDEETNQLIEAIAQRIVGIRTKAEDYSAQLQVQVAEIENSKLGILEEQPVRVNGVVTVGYEPESSTPEVPLLEAREGQEIEILVREMGGWAYCRRVGDKTPGWLPADRIAELAQLIADHEVGDAEGLLNLKLGDVVEVVSRHYSGWAQCRLWTGPQLPGSTNDRQIGWVTDAYLQDNRSEAMLASKWHRLVLQALEEVVAYAVQLETYLAQAKPEDRSADPEWMEKCMQFCLYLGTELQQITDALSQHGLSQNAAGKYATASCEVVGSSEHELSVAQGARVLVIDADNADWIWCRAEDGFSEGWVPRSFLEMEPGSPADAISKDLPDWIKVNERARWWSNSQKQFCDVTITVVDMSARQVTVTFVQDASCWKMVSFEHFLQKQEDWLLQPFQQKAKELIQQLPDWVKPGNQGYWWSSSQHRVLPVQIKDVCSRTRQVKVVFNCNKTVKKLVQFHELIDSPKECLLQKERAGHTWRKPRRKSRDSKGSKESAEAGSQTEVPEDLSATKGLGDIMAEMTQDIGDMMAEGEGEAEDGGLRKALTFMGSSEFLQVDISSKDDSADRVPAFGYGDDELAATTGSAEDSGARSEANAKEETGELVQAGTEVGDAITQEETEQPTQAELQGAEGNAAKGKSAMLMGFSQSEENMMEILEATVEDSKGVTQELPAQEAGASALYDTLDKELLAELAPPSSDEPSAAEGADAEDARRAAAVAESSLTLDAEALLRSQGLAADDQVPSPPATGPDADPSPSAQGSGDPQQAPAEVAFAAEAPAPAPSSDEACANPEPTATQQEPASPSAVFPAPVAEAAGVASDAAVADAMDGPSAGGSGEPLPATSIHSSEPSGLQNVVDMPSDQATVATGDPTGATPVEAVTGEAPAPPPRADPVQGEAVVDPPGAEGAAASPEPQGVATPSPPSPQGLPQEGSHKTVIIANDAGAAGSEGLAAADAVAAADGQLPAPGQPPDSPVRQHESSDVHLTTGAEDLGRTEVTEEATGGGTTERPVLPPAAIADPEAKPEEANEEEEEEGLDMPTELLSPEEKRKAYLEELEREQAKAREAADAAAAAKSVAQAGPTKPEPEEEDLGASVTLQRNASQTTPLLREALRLVAPDSWDSDQEEKTGRKRPDVSRLASCWEILEKDFETVLEAEHQRIDEDLDRETQVTLAKIEAQEKDLKERVQLRAKVAETKDPAKVQQLRTVAESVTLAADTARNKRQAAKAARRTIARQKVLARKQALQKALGPDHTEAASRELLRMQLPSQEAFWSMSPQEALAEVSATAATCFRSLQVVALRPPDETVRFDPENPASAQPSAKDLAFATAATLPELKSCLESLRKRFQEEKDSPPQVDPTLRSIATDEDKMSKDDKRDFIMFEGQQEYDWERSINIKMKEQMRRRDVHTKESLERVSQALHRRWRRQRDRDKAHAMERMAALRKVMDDTEEELDKMRKEQAEATEKEVEALESERRRLQEQTRVLMSAALVVRQEKARINKAWYAEPREKKALTFQSLKIIRRLHADMINFPVTAEFKQKHSVLLYSLRMLEGRLRKDCPYAKDTDIQEGPLEETPELKKQMEEAENAFEDQLSADIDEIRDANREKVQRAMAREAALRRRAAEVELAPALEQAATALSRSERAARRAEIAEDLLRPLGMLASQLGGEAFRHAQLESGTHEPASFNPKRKRLEASLVSTLKVLEEVLPHLNAEEVQKVAAAPSSLGKEPEWEEALEEARSRWSAFCERHPDSVPDEQDTPRGEKTVSSHASVVGRLDMDDLEDDDYGGTAGNEPAKKLPPPPPRKISAAPARPPSAGSGRPPSSPVPPVPGAKAKAAAQPSGTGAQGAKKGAALLEKLDELSATMDRTLGKSSALKTPAPVGGRSLKPPGIGKGGKK